MSDFTKGTLSRVSSLEVQHIQNQHGGAGYCEQCVDR